MNHEVKHSWDRFVNGDIEAFGEVYKHYLPLLTLYCLGVLHDQQTAEHCAAEALVKTMSHQDPATIKDPEKWLFIVAKNQCISELRKVKRLDSNEPLESQTVTEQADSLNREEIDSILQSVLSKEEQEIWQLHSDGYSNSEMSKKLNSSAKTMANKKSDIRAKLKVAFAQHLNLGKNNT